MTDTSRRPSKLALPLVYLVTLVVALAPLTIVDIPILADYPNHLARMHILATAGTDPLLAKMYVVNFHWQPNVAIDLLVPPLAHVLPLDVAGRLFIGLVLVVTLAGVALLHRALFNRWSWWPLCGAFFLYHGELLMGLVNFSFAVGLMFIVLAGWIWLHDRNPWLRLLVSSLLSLVLYFSHVITLGIYGIIIGGYELVRMVQLNPSERWSARTLANWAVVAAQFVVPASLFVVTSPLLHSEFSYNFVWQDKVRGLFMPVLNYNLVLDVATLSIFSLLVAVGLFTRSLRTRPGIFPALFIMGVLFLFVPLSIFGTSHVDHRFTTVMALLFVAGSEVHISSRRLRVVLVSGLMALFVVRMGVVASNWSELHKDLAEFRSAISHVERGSSILVARSLGKGLSKIWRDGPARHYVFNWAPALIYLPTLAVIEKSAFVSEVFTEPGKQTISVTPSYRDMDANEFLSPVEDLLNYRAHPEAPGAQGEYWSKWWTKYDYLFVVYAKYLANRDTLAPDILTPVFIGDLVAVYKIGSPP